MVFADLFFLFVFLPAFALCYLLAAWIDRRKAKAGAVSFAWRNSLLVLFSLIFYAWGEPVYVLLLLASVIVNYFVGLGIDWPEQRRRKTALVLGLVFNRSVLATFKYLSFLWSELAAAGLPVPVPRIALPIGISFYTFQSISYLIDVYRRTTPVQRNFRNLLLYISMFPQLIAGPIVRYTDIKNFLKERKVTTDDFSKGVERFIIGLAKKVLLANTIGEVADKIFAGEAAYMGTAVAWVGAL